MNDSCSTTPKQPWQQMALEIDLPVGVAWWVLLAHLLTILAPLSIVWAVANQWEFLQQQIDMPVLLYATAGLMIAGSILESAQNTFDRWYLTDAPPSVCDFLFHSLITLSLACLALACYGIQIWLWFVMAAGCAGFMLCYLKGWNDGPVRGPIALIAALSFYFSFNDPIIFIQFLAVYLTIYFFGILLSTHNQVMHGFTTIVNAFSALAVAIGIENAAQGVATPWWLLIAVVIVVVAVSLVLKKPLMALPATPRKTLKTKTT